ncbi:hypothetical protein [Nocardia wallacei]|uniref:hypothetical protein n=1 Tax=Nocardia wallacei TaxID=480035 RepID=UPI002455E5A0|nr:hypothetical protein [Nocardia wallacei]
MTTQMEKPGESAQQWAAAAAEMMDTVLEDPTLADDDRQTAELSRVRALQAQAQIYATLEVAHRVRGVETSLPY